MKKLLTLVLAIAMVFAIAAPALALGGDPIKATDTSKNVDLSIALYSGKKSSTTDLDTITPWTQNVLKDQEVTIVVGVTARTADPVIDGTKLSVEISGLKKGTTKANITVTTATTVTGDVKYAADKKTRVDLADAAALNNATHFTKDCTVYYFIPGTADGAISATAKIGYSGALATGTETGKSNVKVFMSAPDTNGYDYTVIISDTSLAGKALVIVVAKTGAVDSIKWGTSGADLQDLAKTNVKNTAGINELQWSTETGAGLPKAEQEAIDAIFAQFGFNWDHYNHYALPSSYIYAQVAGVTKSVSLANALHTASLTVSDPTTVPATGDMSVVGIALAIVALAAAGFVVAKKVRA